MKSYHVVLVAIRIAMRVCAAESKVTPPAVLPSTSVSPPSVTAVSNCHVHSGVQYCVAGTVEYQMNLTTPTTSGEVLPTEYAGCHSHSTTYCRNTLGGDIQVLIGAQLVEPDEPDIPLIEGEIGSYPEETVGHGSAPNCERPDEEYNIPLRVGLIFIILVTGALGVFCPILLSRLPISRHTDLLLSTLKQFGTGVIMSTAFVHLLTEAQMKFASECVGELGYEATAGAIVMAGIIVSFLVEYAGQRFVRSRAEQVKDRGMNYGNEVKIVGQDSSAAKLPTNRTEPLGHGNQAADTMGVTVMEAGMIFHSLRESFD